VTAALVMRLPDLLRQRETVAILHQRQAPSSSSSKRKLVSRFGVTGAKCKACDLQGESCLVTVPRGTRVAPKLISTARC
jgi:hypothetical protein